MSRLRNPDIANKNMITHKKNILFISTRMPYPPVGGHYLRTFNVIKILAKDFNIHLVSFSNPGVDEQEGQFYQKKMQEYCHTCATFNLPEDSNKKYFLWKIGANLFEKDPFVAARYHKNEVSVFLKRLLVKQKIDLIHLDMLPLAKYIDLFRSYCSDVPIVLTDHNVEYIRMLRRSKIEDSFFKRIYCKLQSKKTKIFEKATIEKVDLCVVVSEADKKNFIKFHASEGKIVVLPNGVEIDFFKKLNVESENNNELVWVGGMTDVYNRNAVERFLDKIFPHIANVVPNVIFKIVGRGASAKIKRMALLDPRIQLLGFINDIIPIMSEANVFVAPIYAGSGTKIKVLNAMSMSKAIVSTDIGVEGINVQNGHDLFIVNDDEKFADRVVHLLRNPEKRYEFGRNSRVIIEKYYSWEVIGKKMIKIYNKLIVK